MKKILSYIFLLFLTTEATAQNVETDRSFRTGKLPNGLTYYIRHNAKEAGLADFYIKTVLVQKAFDLERVFCPIF